MDRLDVNQKTIAWLNSVKGVSNRRIEKILEFFDGKPKDLWDNFEAEKHSLTMIKPEILNELSKSKHDFEENILKKLNDENSFVVTIYDDNYPKKLRQIEGAPFILYCKGNLTGIDNLSIAVVGSRKATAYGKWVAEKLTKELSELGVNIISGLAVGIDTIAHKTALKCKAKTIGVIGCGIDIVYPKNNESLFKAIAESGGAVITEYTFGMQPMPNNFHDRNRIISGMSDGVLVIEAQERSGTLITAGHAANQGREIFAVPGNIDSIYSKGTNELIRDGAKITTSIDDIIEEILELKESVKNSKHTLDITNLTDKEREILNSLKSGSKTMNELCEEITLETNELLSILTLLEMKNNIKQITGHKFVLNI